MHSKVRWGNMPRMVQRVQSVEVVEGGTSLAEQHRLAAGGVQLAEGQGLGQIRAG